MSNYSEAVDYINSKISCKPTIGLVLGSGLNDLADEIQKPTIIPYKDIPHFPDSTAPGHKGQLVIGELEGQNVLVMQGRFHHYEGYSMDTIAFPVRVMKLLGINVLIVTNAAGGINKSFKPGDLMVISDHIKWGEGHPLLGPNPSEFGPRFYDMSTAYSPRLIDITNKSAHSIELPLQHGVYSFMTGPNYETPAEIRMLRILGADAVGMSTVPEVLTAVHCGIEVLGISCITNMAAGILDQPITDDEVIETGKMVKKEFAALLKKVIPEI